MRHSPALVLVALATAVVCGGCGGGSAKSFEDVQGCLAKLGVTSAFAPGQDTTTEEEKGASSGPAPETIADVRFRDPGVGAPVLHLVFYKSGGDAKKALAQGESSGIGGSLQPDVVSRTVLVSWATPPTDRQRQLVTDCLEK